MMKVRVRAYTKIAFQLLKRSWRPTLSVSFALNQQEESHGHQDPFAGDDLAYSSRMPCGSSSPRFCYRAGQTTRHGRTPGHTQPRPVRRHDLCVAQRLSMAGHSKSRATYAPGSTVHGRFRQWVQQGVFVQAWQTLLHYYDKHVGIAWKWQLPFSSTG